jgi:hypothetical protein
MVVAPTNGVVGMPVMVVANETSGSAAAIAAINKI